MSLREKIRNQFKTTIPKDYEMEFDICMKCGRRMPDRKYSTYIKHQDEMHKLNARDKRKELFYKHSVLVVFAGMFLTMGIMLFFADPIFNSIAIFSGEGMTQSQYDECAELSIKLKESVAQNGDFGNQHVSDLNRLLHDCNADWASYRFGPTLFENHAYLDPPKQKE